MVTAPMLPSAVRAEARRPNERFPDLTRAEIALLRAHREAGCKVNEAIPRPVRLLLKAIAASLRFYVLTALLAASVCGAEMVSSQEENPTVLYSDASLVGRYRISTFC